MPNLFSLAELEPAEIVALVDRAAEVGESDHTRLPKCLAGRMVGLYFERVSTRTRSSFAVAASRLGANLIMYGPGELQVATGETLADTGMNLSLYLDALVVRTHSVRDIRELSFRATIPVINALTEEEHPTQGIADAATIQQEFGTIEGRHILFAGEGHNIAASLVLALACYEGVRVSLFSPPGFELESGPLSLAKERAARCGASITEIHCPLELPGDADVIYTTRWRSMGQEKTIANWRSVFEPFRVDAALMQRAGHRRTVFMHDLPAERGAEVTDEVLDGPYSRVLRQARNKLASAIATLEWCTAVRRPVSDLVRAI